METMYTADSTLSHPAVYKSMTTYHNVVGSMTNYSQTFGVNRSPSCHYIQTTS